MATWTEELKTKVIEMYESIFDEIDARFKELGLDTPNLTTSSDFYLQKINSG